MVLDCPKVNYKLNYKPGVIVCPRTHVIVKYDDVKDKIHHYAKLPYEFKKQNLTSTPLVDLPHGVKTEFEELADYFAGEYERILGYPFAY